LPHSRETSHPGWERERDCEKMTITSSSGDERKNETGTFNSKGKESESNSAQKAQALFVRRNLDPWKT